FSPTGGTQRVSDMLCEGMAPVHSVTDLCVKASKIKWPTIEEVPFFRCIEHEGDSKTIIDGREN
ncbi:MAG: hypothetical protein PUF62_02665, partial [Bacteroidales bacterium]|nr:hypothetical protein [Bacteroidales bacterium]